MKEKKFIPNIMQENRERKRQINLRKAFAEVHQFMSKLYTNGIHFDAAKGCA